MSIFSRLLIISILSYASYAHAGDSTQTLPKGIIGVRINSIFVTGVDYQFGPSGTKETIGDLHEASITQQAQNMVLGSDVGKLIFSQVLAALQNSPGGSFGISLTQSALQSLDLGYIKTDVIPSISVTVPTILYGVTNFWTLILAVPFIDEKYTVAWNYIPGASTATYDAAASLAHAAGITAIPSSSQFIALGQQTLANKGFKPMASTERALTGDARIGNLFRLGRIGHLSFGALNTIGLPTGPAHDSDLLLDPGSYHHTFIAQELTAVYRFTRKFESYASAGVQYNLAETSNFRVPNDSTDLDPDPSQKEDVTRQIGLGKFVEAGMKYRLLSRLMTQAGLIYTTKDADTFSGSRGLDYAVLTQEMPYSASTATGYKLGLTYDPLNNYQPGSIPLMFDINYEETFAGTSAPAARQLLLALSTFF